ncbi:MAG: hypothetical protein SFX73_09350 [Kofleriaceae bacterium]|nr:hypothetical protein [Kofleriaceae bacterium]
MTTAHDILARAGLRASSDLAFALERTAELASKLLDADRGYVWLADASGELMSATSFERTEHVRTWGRISASPTALVVPLTRAGMRVAAIGAERARTWTDEDRDALSTLADATLAIFDQAAWIGAHDARAEAEHVRRDGQAALGRLAALLAHDLNTITATLALTADNLSVMEDAPDWLAERAKDLDQLVADHRPITEQLRELARGRVIEVIDVNALFAQLAPLLDAMPRRIVVVPGTEAVVTRGVRREHEHRVLKRLIAICDVTPRDATVTVRIGPKTMIDAGDATIELVLGDAPHAATSARDSGTKKPV